MDIKEKLLVELKDAMREKDEIRKNTITLARAAILQVEKDNLKVLNEDEVIEVLAKECKKRKESKVEYEKTGREDIVADLCKEILILEKYLPKMLTEEEVRVIVSEKIKKLDAKDMKDMGRVMKEVKADGKLVSDIVRELLS